MRIAIAQWRNRISPLFDVSDRLCIIDVKDGRESRREERVLTSGDPLTRAREILGLGLDMLICGAISRPLEMALIEAGIRVTSFMCGDLEAVFAAFLSGTLADGEFFMPGCRGEHLRRRFRGGQGKGRPYHR